MTLSLATSTVQALLSGDPPEVRERFSAAMEDGEDIRVCSIVVQELAFEILQGERSDRRMAALGEFLTNVEVEPFSADDAFEAARLRSDLAKSGWSRTSYGLLVVGQAINRGWTLVTRDPQALGHAGELTLVDWTGSGREMSYADLMRASIRLRR